MRERILTDKEIDNIFRFNTNKHRRMNVVDLFHALAEKTGLYEAEKDIQSCFFDKSIVLTDFEKKRSKLEQRALMVTGNIENNPKDICCPECGCKYIVFYGFHCFLRPVLPDYIPKKGQRLTAECTEYGEEEYCFCLGCGYKF